MFPWTWKGNCNRQHGHRVWMSKPICWKAPACVCGPASSRKRRHLCYPEVPETIARDKVPSEGTVDALKKAIAAFKGQFKA